MGEVVPLRPQVESTKPRPSLPGYDTLGNRRPCSLKLPGWAFALVLGFGLGFCAALEVGL